MIAQCHPERKYYGRGMCRSCYSGWWLKEHPETSQHRALRLIKHNNNTLLKRYGLSLDQREQLKAEQSYRCGICFKLKSLNIDHDHKTGKVRGMLCDRCNSLVSYFDENPELIINASIYLSPRFDFELNKIGTDDRRGK